MLTRAAVLHAMGCERPYSGSRPLSIEEVELDPPGPGEVLVTVAAAGVCHSDLSVVNGSRPRQTPLVMGHEGAGVVAEVGPGVRSVAPGDPVVFVFVPCCGTCSACLDGRPALCIPGAAANGAGTLLGGAIRLHRGDRTYYHQVGVSCFATHAVMSERSLVKIDRDLPLDQAALFGCAVITGVGAVVNTARVRTGESVAVVGLGGVGFNALLGARVAGAGLIVGIDPKPQRLELARSLGAHVTVLSKDPDCVAKVRSATGGGVDHAIEAAGSASAMELSYAITRRGGQTVSCGLPHPEQKFQVQHVGLVAEERTVRGSYLGSCVPIRDIPRYIALYREGRLPIDRLITQRVGLDEINVAMDRLDTSGAIRQIVMM